MMPPMVSRRAIGAAPECGHGRGARYGEYDPLLPPLFPSIFLLSATPLLAGFIVPESAQATFEETAPASDGLASSRHARVRRLARQADDYLVIARPANPDDSVHANLAKRWLGEGNDRSSSVVTANYFVGDVSVQQSLRLVRRDAQVTETADFLATVREASGDAVRGSSSRRRQTLQPFIRTTCRPRRETTDGRRIYHFTGGPRRAKSRR